MADASALRDEIVRRFAAIVEMDPAEVDTSKMLGDDYGMDSLKAVRLVAEVEMEFDVDVPEEGLSDIKTLDDVVTLVERLQQEGELDPV